MPNGFRFGRRLTLPSTVEIKHELRMVMLADSVDALHREAAASSDNMRGNLSFAGQNRWYLVEAIRLGLARDELWNCSWTERRAIDLNVVVLVNILTASLAISTDG